MKKSEFDLKSVSLQWRLHGVEPNFIYIFYRLLLLAEFVFTN